MKAWRSTAMAWGGVALWLLTGGIPNARAGFDFGKIKQAAKDAAKVVVDEVERQVDPEEPSGQTPGSESGQTSGAGGDESASGKTVEGSGAEAATGANGKTVFSKQPIDAKNPANLTTAFKAGDPIYARMLPAKSWRELYGDKAQTQAELLLMWTLDGKEKVGGYIVVKKPEVIDSAGLTLDIAPELDRMTAYRDAFVEYGDWRGIRKGACQFAYELGLLKPGKHRLELWVNDYGQKYALGSFEIEGDDYSSYTTLQEKIKDELSGSRTMPAAKQVNAALAAQMTGLLENAGWPNVLRLNIVDKDWWTDLVDGGDSPVKSRHMDAAAAFKDADGQCYYRVCQFHQQMLITGNFGPLELTHQGEKVPIAEQNIGK